MLKRFLVLSKYFILVLAITTGVISCEKDFKNIGEDLLNSNLFSTGKYNALIQGHTLKINSNKTNGMDNYILGYTSNSQFGSLSASIVAQFTIPETNLSFGNNAVIDSVVFIIPYQSTIDGKQEVPNPANPTVNINVPNFKLDSVWTSSSTSSFELKIYELGTYLNNLNPNDPYVANEFFSNDVFQKTGTPLYSGMITPNRNDTMMVINRYKYENASLTNRILYKKDTIKLTNSKPSLKIPLNKAKIKQIFQDNAGTSHFASNDNFTHYFRGLYLEALNSGNGTVLMNFKTSEAYMSIYFTETKVTNEGATEDLNGNGIMGEQNVVIPTARIFNFNMSGIKANLFERNHNGSTINNYLLNPNIANGDDKIFVHGAAGSDGVIKLFGSDANNNAIPDELETLRTKNWLINDAKLFLYVDPVNNTNLYPKKLYLYSLKGTEKHQTYEVLNQGITMFSGNLVLDTDNNPDYYLFHLTDYVSKILKSNPDVAVVDFGLKTYDPSDVPLSVSDTIMRKFNNEFKGVIITGNVPSIPSKKLKLEISYTEKNP